MTPAELRIAAQALAARIGPGTMVDFAIWSSPAFDGDAPARVHIVARGISLSAAAATFEEALILAEMRWESRRDELRQTALAAARARVAELETA